MNCQDISRIVDSRSLDGLTAGEQREIEAHALSCRQCAAGWLMHARLAELQIPPMPAELAVRCRTIAAAPVRAINRHRAPRRIVLAGSVAAMAAAAGMLAVRMADIRAPASSSVSKALQPAEAFATPAAGTNPVSARDGAEKPEAPTAVVKPPQARTLPLLPAPVYADRKSQLDLALQRAVARYPEMVQGPEIEGRFVLVLTMRENGEVLSSAMRVATPQNDRDVTAELDRMLPRDAGNQTSTMWMKANPLPDGRLLRTNASVRYSVVPNDYDESRSSVRVQEILRSKYAELMLPSGGNEISRVTVFLSGDGNIERESTERARLEDMQTMRSDEPSHVERFAESIASKLSLDVAQIGLMGVTTVEEGSMAVVLGADGNSRPDDRRRRLFVYYAWQRRPGETAPKWGQGGRDARQPKIDLAAALAIAERQLPEAFTALDRSAGDPTVVLTAKGEFIRAGWVKPKPGEPIARTLQDQLVPGVQTSSFMSQRLTNATGGTADISFAWEQPVPGKEVLKN